MTIESRLTRRRRVRNALASVLMSVAVVLAMVSLIAVLAYTVVKGLKGISWQFLTHSMKGVGPLDSNGGAYHAILGTLEQVAIAFVIAVPLGLLVAIYIVEVGSGRWASMLRFLIDVMTGMPSIVAGLFVFSFWVLALHRGFSGFAAGLALAILMLPIVIRSSEEMLKLVPNELREAAYALGIPKWRTIVSIVLPSAASGITTGIVLAVARVAGETAPLLLTAFGYEAIRRDPFSGPQSALPLFVFSQASSAFAASVTRAWAAALTLIVIVLLLTVLARVLSARTSLGSNLKVKS